MGTGLIVAFVVAIWAAYFVPLVLRRYDEASTSSSLETLSPLSRVINRPRVDEDIASPEPAVEPVKASREPAQEATPTSEHRPGVTRAAARVAARRRRRTLLTLLTATAIVGGLVGLAVIAVWSIVIPVALVLGWLVACRVQVRAERGISHRSSSRSKAAVTDEEATVIVSGQVEDVDPGRKHIMESTALEADALEEQLVIAAPSIATTGDLVWDPLPVTLPTYVTKPRAGRTVRTIDFAQPGAWTSGHVEGEDVELPGAKQASDDAPRRAASQ